MMQVRNGGALSQWQQQNVESSSNKVDEKCFDSRSILRYNQQNLFKGRMRKRGEPRVIPNILARAARKMELLSTERGATIGDAYLGGHGTKL